MRLNEAMAENSGAVTNGTTTNSDWIELYNAGTNAANIGNWSFSNSGNARKYIFPGGMLPSEKRLRQETGRAGLEWRTLVRFGQHYADTLAEWARRFDSAWEEISALGGRMPPGLSRHAHSTTTTMTGTTARTSSRSR